MSDAVQEAAPVLPVEGPSAGTLLRRAREAAGMHAEALAVSLKVPIHKLEALEADRYDLLTDTVFTRGLASSMCRVLKIDPRPVLERLPQGSLPRLVNDTDRINMPFRGPGDGPAPSWRGQLRRPAVLIVLALLLGAVAVILWPASMGDTRTMLHTPPAPQAPVAEPHSQPAAPVPAAAGGAGIVTTTTPSPAPGAANAQAPAPVQSAATAPAPGGAPVVAGAPVPAAVSALQVPPAQPATAPNAVQPATAAHAIGEAGDVLAIRAKGETWVEVVDAKGTAVLRKLLSAGESASASGVLPLSVTIGKADAAEVQVRGKPFELGPVSRDKVARFEVK